MAVVWGLIFVALGGAALIYFKPAMKNLEMTLVTGAIPIALVLFGVWFIVRALNFFSYARPRVKHFPKPYRPTGQAIATLAYKYHKGYESSDAFLIDSITFEKWGRMKVLHSWHQKSFSASRKDANLPAPLVQTSFDYYQAPGRSRPFFIVNTENMFWLDDQ